MSLAEYAQTIFMLAAVMAGMFFVYWLWKKYIVVKLKKALRKIGGAFLNFFSFVGAKLAKLKDRFSLPSLRKSSRLTHYHDEKIRIFGGKERDRLRKLKWRQLRTNRERVRFFYIEFLRKKMKKGAVIPPSATPNELAARLQENHDLFALYNEARYDNDIIDLSNISMTKCR
jgi:hypothetical protein